MTPIRDMPRLQAGFTDPVFDSQATFRSILDAMAYPGRIQVLEKLPEAPAGIFPAAAATCLTLIDFETPLWLDPLAATDETIAYLRFHCGVPLVAETHAARFALITAAVQMPRLDAFAAGADQYPDRSATLILQVPSLAEGPQRTWSGPGINGSIVISIAGLAGWFWHDWDLNCALYPLGVDIIFACRDAVVALPRTIQVRD